MPRRCCIPGCKSNYDSTIRKTGTVSTFSIPRDEDKRKSWLQAIRRRHWSPSRSSVVCSKHFSPEDVIRLEKIIDNEGKSKDQVLKNPKLREGAIPHIFPQDWSKVLMKSSQLREHDYAAPLETDADTPPPKIVKATSSSCPPALPTTAVLEPDDQKILIQAATKHTVPDMGRENDAVTNLINDNDNQRSMNIHKKASQAVSGDQDLDNMDTAACDELFEDEVTKAGILQDHNETDNFDTKFKIEQENRELLVPGSDDDDIVAEIDNDDDDFIMNLMASKMDGTDNCGECEDDDHYVPQQHQGVCCNVCLGNIVGFRYRCCECEDYDMCSDCESRQQHPQHYVLRIPGYRKQSEIRRVMAAVHLSLALPADVKDEPIIKIEDPVEEQPPDPLHTEEIDSSLCTAAASDMATDDQMTFDPSTSLDQQTPLDPLNSCQPKKPTIQHEPRTLKLIGHKCDIPVLLEALHRRAIVQLEDVMHKSAARLCTQTQSLLNIEQQDINQIRRKRKLGPKKCNTDVSPYYHNLQDREKTKEPVGRKLPIILRAKQLKQDVNNDSFTQPLFSSQSTEKKRDDVIFPHVTSDKKDKPIYGGGVTNSEEKNIKPADGSSFVQNSEKIFKMIPTDGCSMEMKAEEKVFKMIPAESSSVIQSKEKYYKMVSTDTSSMLLNKEKIFRMVLADGSTGIKKS